jgi:hypothetical protein
VFSAEQADYQGAKVRLSKSKTKKRISFFLPNVSTFAVFAPCFLLYKGGVGAVFHAINAPSGRSEPNVQADMLSA